MNKEYMNEESALYRSNQPTLKDFYYYVLKNPKAKKSYFQIASTNIRIPSDTIIHDVKKHNLSYFELEDFLWNLDNIINAKKARKNINGAETYLVHIKGTYHFGATIMLGRENSIYFNTIFLDHPNSIDNWITEGSRTRNAAQPTDSSHQNDSVAIYGLDPTNSITYLKGKIKMSESKYKETLISISEKLKKIVIAPQKKIILDDMEDETGLNIEECMTSAQIGPAPTPTLAYKKNKSKSVKDINKEIEEIMEAINDEGNIGIDDTIIAWLDNMNFKNSSSDEGYLYYYDSGNYEHIFYYNKKYNNPTIKYIINNETKQKVYENTWFITEQTSINDILNRITTIFNKYE